MTAARWFSVSIDVDTTCTRWFVRDGRGYVHLCADREAALFEAGKPGHEQWSVMSQRVEYGPLRYLGSPWDDQADGIWAETAWPALR